MKNPLLFKDVIMNAYDLKKRIIFWQKTQETPRLTHVSLAYFSIN